MNAHLLQQPLLQVVEGQDGAALELAQGKVQQALLVFLQSELRILLSPGQRLFVHTHHVVPLSLRRVGVETLQQEIRTL